MNGMKKLEKKKENLELRVESWTRLNLQGRVLLQPCETENSGPDRPSGSETQSCCLRGSKQKNKKNKIKAGTCLGVRFCTHTHAHAPLKSVSMTSEPFFLVARREICSANCSRRSRRVCWLSAWQCTECIINNDNSEEDHSFECTSYRLNIKRWNRKKQALCNLLDITFH